MGSFGETKTVKAAITSLSGKNMGKIIIFQANDVDILWQAETYTPPFYQGYARPSFGSDLKLFAIPHIKDSLGNTIAKDKLIFNWQKDGKNLPLAPAQAKIP